MPVQDTTRTAVEVIRTQQGVLRNIEQEIRDVRDVTHGRERLEQWKTRTITLLRGRIPDEQVARLKGSEEQPPRFGDLHEQLIDEARAYEEVLEAMNKQMKDRPVPGTEATAPDGDHAAGEATEPPTDAARPAADGSAGAGETAPEAGVRAPVFLVHGRDELNSLRLEKLLRVRWKLEPIVLSDEFGSGRVPVDAFEGEARRAGFAIVLFSPEDEAADDGGAEANAEAEEPARSRMLFELGWFYGRLGRDRVCVLAREGTRLPGGFDGLPQVAFSDSVAEARKQLERAFVEAGVL